MEEEKMVIAVTGTTGQLGGRVARLLADQGISQILIGRDPAAMPDLPHADRRGPVAYDQLDAMAAALAGTSDLLLVSASLSGRRLEEHATTLDAAVRAGVERVVYVSLLGAGPNATYMNARDHWQTEQYLAVSGVRWTVLRAGLYALTLLRLADEDGVIRGPAEDGRVSLLAHDDLAAVCTSVLTATDDRHDSRIYSVTGPEAPTIDEAARQVSDVMVRSFSYEPETVVEAWQRLRREGRGNDRDAAWISWYMAVAAGEVDEVNDVVERLTGRRPVPAGEAVRRG
jgi:NAD(P)H dehydrogenase (quinone)